MTTYYFDVTKTLEFDLHTGIQRVVRQIFRRCQNLMSVDGDTVIPVVAIDRHFYALSEEGVETLLRNAPKKPPDQFPTVAASASWYRRILRRTMARLPRLWANILERRTNSLFRTRHLALYEPSPLDIGPDDVLVLLDHFFGGSPVVAAARIAAHRGARIVTLVYDMIPITHPQFMTPLVRSTFRRGLLKTARVSMGLLTISDFCVQEIERFLTPHFVPPPIRRFYLGYDILETEPGSNVDSAAFTAESAVFWEGNEPIFVMVGSIEPRKGHELVLDGFDRAWHQGCNGKLLIVGHPGWDMDDFLVRYGFMLLTYYK